MKIWVEKFKFICMHMLGVLTNKTLDQGEDYLVENFSATSGGKFTESTKNQIFGASMCKTLI